MAGYVGNSEKIVDSAYLYSQFQNFDKRRESKLDEALFITTPKHYEQSDSGNPSALEIVADGTSITGSQIEVSNVTPLKDGDLWTPSIGEYAVLVAEVKKDIYLKATTLNKEDTDLDLNTFDAIVP